MFLNASQIAQKRAESAIIVEPFEHEFLKAASYVLRLGNKVRRWVKTNQPIDVWSIDCCANALGPIESFSEICINHGDFLLVNSHERIGLADDLLGIITTLSHISRLGISVTSDSHLVSPGFGKDAAWELTFEITSHNPNTVRLRAGLPICHLLLTQLDVATSKSVLATSVYQSLPTPFGPALFEDFSRLPAFKREENWRG